MTSASRACSAATCSAGWRCTASVTEISDRRERGKVVNAAWRRYGAVDSASLLAVVAGWAGARAEEARPARLSGNERRLAVAKDVLVGVVAVSGVATGLEGMRFARQAPNGAVPLEDGEHTAAEATEAQRRSKRRVNALGLVSLGAELALVGVNAALGQEGSAGRRAGAPSHGAARLRSKAEPTSIGFFDDPELQVPAPPTASRTSSRSWP